MMPTSTLCSECGVQFSNNTYLKTHIQTVHRKVRDHECLECKKRFTVKFSLLRHVRQIHTKVKPYACQYCHLKFSDWTTKVRHERTHTKIRPYSCNTCSKTFSYSSVLRAHLKSHRNEPEFVCSKCNKAFTLKFNLEVHYKRQHLHSTEKPNKITEETKPLGPLFIDTEQPKILKCTILPGQSNFSQFQILNLPAFVFQNPNKPLKVFVANI